MTELDEICETAIGDARDRGAATDFIEACRRYFVRRKVRQDELPLYYCRLGEVLLHRADRDHAVECAHAAFDLQPESEEVAHISAWIFSNCESGTRTPRSHTSGCSRFVRIGPKATVT